ncbi:MAG: class I SAM-dependent methyltransferase [Chlamydiae bacterium]|nr:class I SAM-dependent methyltransferase [Chlamydiota bacterium]
MKKLLTLAFCLCLISTAYTEKREDLPEPYNTIEVLPFDSHGWYSNAQQMEALLQNRSVKIVIEVGSWLGCSTRHIASVVPSGSKVYAIDHWLGSVEHQPGSWANYKALPYLYEQFLSNVIHANLTDKIIPLRMSSLEAAQYFSTNLEAPVDIVYLDASHDTESVYNDMRAWYPFVEGHGILCGDDWGWESVRVAVNKFAREKKMRLHASGNFWYLTEK